MQLLLKFNQSCFWQHEFFAGFYVVRNSQLEAALASKADQPSYQLGQLGFTIHLEDQPLLLTFSSSGLILAVCMMRQDIPVAFLYDTRSFVRMVNEFRNILRIMFAAVV